MQFFSGRFKEEASQTILDFHASIGFDKRLYKYDIMGSIAHVRGLAHSKIISQKEAKTIEKTLRAILKDIQAGKIEFLIKYEDIHMNIEKILIDRIGDVGKKLHTGRSRNDQVALDTKLFTRDEIIKIEAQLLDMIQLLNTKAKENLNTFMPGFTHLQKAQPITFAHYLMAYIEMFRRDFIRLQEIMASTNTCPLGSVALAGTTYPIDRQYTSDMLGFAAPTWNSIDGVSDRDYIIEAIDAMSIIMMHLSRLCEEIVLYASNDYKYIELSDSYSTGSSIMPQKKNPDAAELVRGKTGRVYGHLIGILTMMKDLPLAYNKDMQEDKEHLFDSIDTVKGCLLVCYGMIETMTVNKDIMLAASAKGFMAATDVADYLTTKGMSFRDAYKIVGKIVVYCIDKGYTLETLKLEDYKKFSKLFSNDVYKHIDIKTCVEKRTTFGGPSPQSVKKHIDFIKRFIKKNERLVIDFKLNDIL